MKKFYIYAMMAAGLLASCSKEDVKTNEINDNSIEKIRLGVQNTVSVTDVSGSRGGGALGKEWNGDTLKLIGVNDTQKKFIFEGQDVKAPTSGVSGALTFPKGTEYFYESKDRFDFYGYFVDDAEANVLSNSSLTAGYALDVTIDGTQDVMIAKANPTEDVKSATETVDAKYAYSAYTSRRGVIPTLDFKHQLTKLVFNAQATSNLAKPLQITKIAIKDVNTGTLTIIPGTSYAKTGFKEGTKKGEYDLKMASAQTLTTKMQQIGTNLLIFPKAKYEVSVSTLQEGAKKTTKTFTAQLASGEFAAGSQYAINFKLSGEGIVEAKATLTDWVDGGNIDINDDEKPTI